MRPASPSTGSADLAAVIEALPCHAIWLDPGLHVVRHRAGPGLSPFVAQPASGKRSQRLDDLLPPDIADPIGDAAIRCRAGEALSPVPVPLLRDSEPVFLEARFVRLECGEVLVLLQDVTERERMRLELERTTSLLERSNAELEQFAYVASHDLQEPLRTVASFCELIRRRYDDRLDEDGREFIEFAVDGARRMQSLIADLLSLSRIASRGAELVPEDLGRIAHDALASLKTLAEEKGASIDIGPLPTLPVDRLQMTQVFASLLSNAIRYHGEEPPRIAIAAERDGPLWRITVADNGIGIPPEFAERVFQVFQRLHTRDEHPGNGIGLALCRKIVHRHGGRIAVQPNRPCGSCFVIGLPVGGQGGAVPAAC